jgi:hypothetical protein
MTAAGRFARIIVLLAAVAASPAIAPTPVSAQVDCGRGMSVFSCMAMLLGQITYSLSMTPEERRAQHEDAIQAIRDKWGTNQMMAAREIARYRYGHNIDVFNRPILGADDVPESLTADSVRNAAGPVHGSASGTVAIAGAPADNDPVEMCWGGSLIKRSQCPPRPGP